MSDEPLRKLDVELTLSQVENLERFQLERGVATRDAALRLLLDVAFEAVSGRGRRYWDTKVVGE